MRSCSFVRWFEVCRTSILPLGKVLILLVGNCCLGVLNRGSENLEAPCEGVRFYSFRLYEKNGEYPRGLRTSGLQGAIQISARYEISAEVTGQHHVTGCVGHDNLPGYRRWGFESVRKGSRTSDARLQSFKNGLFCCKLTVASGIQKGLLHVSLGVVQSWSFACWEKAFLYRLALHESKKQACFAKQKRFFFVETLSNYTRKLPFLRTKAFLLHKPFFVVLKKFPFP